MAAAQHFLARVGLFKAIKAPSVTKGHQAFQRAVFKPANEGKGWNLSPAPKRSAFPYGH
jgi:hypothetical protein